MTGKIANYKTSCNRCASGGSDAVYQALLDEVEKQGITGATIDFSGTSGVHPGNLNATPAVVRSAVIYVLRVLIDEPLPLNEGLMRAVDLKKNPAAMSRNTVPGKTGTT